MFRERKLFGGFALGLVLALGTGCETDEGEAPDAGADTGADTGADAEPDVAPLVLRDLEVRMEGMDPHVDQLMEFRVVDSEGTLVAKGILDPLPVAIFTFFMPDAVPEGDYDVDFYADLSGNGSYDAPPDDHAWRLELPETGIAQVDFVHNTTFTDIGASAATEGGDFSMNLSGMAPHVGQLMELRVIVADTGQVVGRYLLGEIADADFNLSITGIIENGVDYNVDFYADLNGNTVYDGPPDDHAWRLTGTGAVPGLTVNFTHNTDFTDVEF